MKILLVGYRDETEPLAKTLRRRGHDVLESESHDDAVEFLKGSRIDLIAVISEGNSAELGNTIRRNWQDYHGLAGFPCGILIGETAERLAGFQNGFTHFISTPYTVEEIDVLINSIAGESFVEKEKHRYDSLTGLFTRKSFFEEVAAWIKEEKPFGIAYVDLDGFGDRINNRYGHLMGDKFIEVYGRRLRHSLKGSNIAGRYGGDEVVVAIDCGEKGQLYAAAERLRKVIAETPFHIEGAPLIQLTVSVGVALRTEKDEPVEELIARADSAMYRAKKKNNCVAFYGEEEDVARYFVHQEADLDCVVSLMLKNADTEEVHFLPAGATKVPERCDCCGKLVDPRTVQLLDHPLGIKGTRERDGTQHSAAALIARMPGTLQIDPKIIEEVDELDSSQQIKSPRFSLRDLIEGVRRVHERTGFSGVELDRKVIASMREVVVWLNELYHAHQSARRIASAIRIEPVGDFKVAIFPLGKVPPELDIVLNREYGVVAGIYHDEFNIGVVRFAGNTKPNLCELASHLPGWFTELPYRVCWGNPKSPKSERPPAGTPQSQDELLGLMRTVFGPPRSVAKATGGRRRTISSIRRSG